jgi:phosphate transport system protein
MGHDNGQGLALLKEKLLTMASHAEAAGNRAVKALLRRDDELASRIESDDSVVDRLEIEIDELAMGLLAQARPIAEVRRVAVAMKIARELERIADEATTIARRTEALNREPQLKQSAAIPPMASLALNMLKEALDAFVGEDSAKARAVIARDAEVDRLNRQFREELKHHMAGRPEAVDSCLHLMVIAKSLERMADHATNVAEEVVYLCEGLDIRHTGKSLAE